MNHLPPVHVHVNEPAPRTRQRLSLLILISVLGLSPVAWANDKPATPEQLLAQVQKRYDSVKDFSTEFQQTFVRAARMGKNRSEIGKLFLMRPDLLRVDYDEPTVKNIIVDGKRLWAYKPDDGAVAVYDNYKKADISAGLSFLWDNNKKLAAEFDVKHFTGPDPLDEPVAAKAIRLTPKKEDPNIKTLTFYLDDQGFIEKAFIEDQLGNANVFKFRHIQVDQKLKKNAFLFAPPPGVKVVHID